MFPALPALKQGLASTTLAALPQNVEPPTVTMISVTVNVSARLIDGVASRRRPVAHAAMNTTAQTRLAMSLPPRRSDLPALDTIAGGGAARVMPCLRTR